MSGLTQRKRAAGDSSSVTSPLSSAEDSYQKSFYSPATGAAAGPSAASSSAADAVLAEFKADEDGFTDADLEGKKVKLTLMEEILLLGLRDEQGWYSWWNENMSYVLRGCMIAELALRGRIAVFKEVGGRHHRKPYYDRLVDVVDDTPTGEALLDEALKIMKSEQATDSATGKPGKRYSISQWIDLLSGETWNLLKYSYQMKLVRERLSKGLVDKGVLRTEKKYFVVFEMTTHPVTDGEVKGEVVQRLINCLTSAGRSPSRRTVLLCCAAYAANVLDNALGASKYLKRSLSYTEKDACFARCEEMLADWSGASKNDEGTSTVNRSQSDVGGQAFRDMSERGKLGWNDVMSGVVGVFHVMDTMI